MASLFSSRRKPKRIAREEPEAQADEVEEGMFSHPSYTSESPPNYTLSDAVLL